MLGLTSCRAQLPSQMSGGEQQRVAIAPALITGPKLLLADEPTGNLDRSSGTDVMNHFRRLNDHGQTVVIVTHDPAVASHAQRVAFMRDGQLVDCMRITNRGNTSQLLPALARLEDADVVTTERSNAQDHSQG